MAAKQMLGLHRQFVFARESCQRLPELALLAGNVLTYLAAVLPTPAHWLLGTTPKKTAGCLRRVLAQADFPKDCLISGQLRKKRSVTGHLPKDVTCSPTPKTASLTGNLAFVTAF
jgi:hypothetical protein